MKDTAPKEFGIIVVAGLFGLIALLLSYLVLDFAGFASVIIGALVALIAAIVLWLGWREPAAGPTGPRDLSVPAHTPAATSTAAAEPEVPAAEKPVPAPEKAAPSTAPSTPAPAAAPAAAMPAARAARTAPAKKPAAKAAKTEPAATKPVAADGKPEMLSKPRGGAGDDLKQIKGVGPKLEAMLNKMGVWHFDQVSSWRAPEVAWVDENLEGFKGRVSRDNWVDQAKVLAEGGTTEFSKKVKKGGVY